MKSIVILLLVIFMFSCVNVPNELSLIPKPNSIESQSGFYFLNNYVSFSNCSINIDAAIEYFSYQLAMNFPVQAELKSEGEIAFKIDSLLGNEAYRLNVVKQGVEISASAYNGFFYGLETLLQLIDQAEKTDKGIKIPCVQISDEPEFAWRGMHLDVCRHFFDVDFVKKMLDAMAMHKMNTFHWHLTDDQGWRIEIEKYPKLSEISAWRSESVIGHIAEYPVTYDGTKHGGFYTKDQIREVVAYAASLGITIVPEIEMPGHAVAALMAYPELSCTGKPKPFNDWGVSNDVYCAGNEKTFEFSENVLSEVVELFPGEYIHVGGDECPKDKWKECPKCQKRIQNEGLKDEHELQSYFIQRMEKFLNSKGKKLIGWDEILEGGLADNAAVMSWRGEEGGAEAANLNHYVVMTPNPICYLDHYQSDNYEPLAIGGLTTMDEIYNWSPIPTNLDTSKVPYILGAQGNVWTEYIPNSIHVEYMVYPRLCAMAEMLWTKRENQNYTDFVKRMNFHYNRLDAKGINYRIPYPNIEPYNPILTADQKIELSNGIETSSIYYTTDGSNPTEKSTKYKDPFVLDLTVPVSIKAVAVMPSGRKSAIVTGTYEMVVNAEAVEDSTLIQGITFEKYNREFNSAFDVNGEPDKTTIIKQLELPYEQPLSFYGARFSGYIEVPDDGVYTFYLHVKDGGILYISDHLVINNDGFKYGREKSGRVALMAGKHPFVIKYFMGKGWNELGLKYKVNNSEIMAVEPIQYFTKTNN